MTTDSGILARVEREIGAGRIWRAKEILRGALATRAEPGLLERYGRLPEELGDRYEAGKYLFLSGERRPEYKEAINVFLTRNAARRDSDFVALFPAAVRRMPFDRLPAPVREELNRRGMSASRFMDRARAVPAAPYTIRDRFVMLFSVLIGLILFLGLGLGIAQIVNWIWRVVF